MRRVRSLLACLVFLLAMGTAAGADPTAIERGLDLAGSGIRRAGVGLAEAMAIVVITGSDNGTTPAEAIIRRAAIAYGWPALPPFGD